MPGDDPRNRQAVEHGEFGLDQRRQLGGGMMHEPTGSVNMLPDMMEPKTGGIALEAIERAAAHDFHPPYLRDGYGQQQIGATLTHVARKLPFFSYVARQQIEFRPADDIDILRVLRRRGFAEGHARG